MSERTLFEPTVSRIAADSSGATRGLKVIENPGVPLSSQNILAAMGWDSSDFTVNEKTALKVPAVWAAVNFFANTIASLPLQVYRRTKDSREKVKGGIATVLHDSPNGLISSFRWRHQLMTHLLTHGRHYSLIERSNTGAPKALHPLDYTKVDPKAGTDANGIPMVSYQYEGRDQPYRAEDILDIVWMLEADGVTHVRPVSRLQGSLSLSMALQEYADRFFSNGGVPPLALQGPFTSPASVQHAAADVTQAIKRAANAGEQVLPIPLGNELKPIGFNPEQGQMLEARRFQIEEVARLYQLSPIFLQDLSRGTFSNTEQQDLHVTKHSVSHHVVRIEQEINLKLFRGSRARYAEFNLDGLLRGDFKSRMEGYAQGIQNGVLQPDEARAHENRPKEPGGDRLYMQGQMTPIDKLGEEPQ